MKRLPFPLSSSHVSGAFFRNEMDGMLLRNYSAQSKIERSRKTTALC